MVKSQTQTRNTLSDLYVKTGRSKPPNRRLLFDQEAIYFLDYDRALQHTITGPFPLGFPLAHLRICPLASWTEQPPAPATAWRLISPTPTTSSPLSTQLATTVGIFCKFHSSIKSFLVILSSIVNYNSPLIVWAVGR